MTEDAIREQADILAIVRPYVNLVPEGRRHNGTCPFCQSDSLTVSSRQGLWHCFGCKAGGDIFRFVELREKCSHEEAVRRLGEFLSAPRQNPP